LKSYVGAANVELDGGYTAKVMAEHAKLRQVASGRQIPTLAPAANPQTSSKDPVTPPEAPVDESAKTATIALR
jgi:hypothetical protein